MSQLNVNTIKNRTGTSGPVLSGLSTVSGSLVVSSDATVSGAATVTGALTVGGVLTYEDVTNVDSVGIITARTGLEVTANGLVINAGVSTFSAALDINAAANISGDLTIADKVVHDGDTDTAIRFPAANTFSVETAGSEAIRVDSSQRLLVNTATTRNNYDNGSVTSNLLHVERTAASGNAGISICANAATAADVGAILYMGRTSATSNGGSTIVENDDLIGRISFQGADGSELVEAACIRVDVDGAPAANDMPGRIEFWTTPDGSASPSERMRITSTGRIGINIDNPDSYNSSGNNLVLGATNNNGGLTIVSSTTNNGHIFFADGGGAGPGNRGIIKYEHGNDAMAFNTAEAERLRLTSGGDLLVGHGSVISNMKYGGSGDFGSHAEIIGANKGFANGLAILNYDATATIPAVLKLATSRNDTAGSNTIVGNAGDNCASIQFMGNDGTRFIDLARIDGLTDGTPGSDDMPGRLSFFTTADGASVVTERMRIDSSGNIDIGGTVDSAPNISLNAAGTALFNEQSTNGRVEIDSNGQIQIGTTYDITSTTARGARLFGGAVGGFGGLIVQSTSSATSVGQFFAAYRGTSTVFQVTTGGNLSCSGSLSKGSGSFKIDHPLKSETHHLVHSFVEGPQADNIYRGKVDLVDGTAAVNIDTVAGMTEGTFAALNREIQCFTTNETGWTAIKGSVTGNVLTITAQENTCTDTISWLVIGERKDQHMYDTEWTDENGKVIVEPAK